MLNLPRLDLIRIKKILLRQQKEVASQLDSIETNDPATAAGLAPEALESGTASWMAEAHGRLSAVKDDLLVLSTKITNSLLRIRKGTYGKCESCGHPIEPERLEALPTATLCVACSKNGAKKKR